MVGPPSPLILSVPLPVSTAGVLLNGQESEWLTIKVGVPQGSILGPLFFLIYIKDISDNLESNVKFFADDTSLFSVVRDPVNTSQKLNNDLDRVSLWANK